MGTNGGTYLLFIRLQVTIERNPRYVLDVVPQNIPNGAFLLNLFPENGIGTLLLSMTFQYGMPKNTVVDR
jgi:hypothetical protein